MATTQADPSAKPMSEKQRLKLEKSSSRAKESKEQEAPAVKLKDWVEKTPMGQRKILKQFDGNFTKAYLPTVVELAWYSFWENHGLFKPRTEEDGSLKLKGK
ncbi:hypothetical protein BDW66DRAFT_146743 [Aspergillus desertorum]